MAFELPKLDYDYNALEPHIDEKTMKIHHDKHHAAYVKNLNAALDGQKEFDNLSIEEILSDISIVPDDVQQAVINNGGGHANHSLFWAVMSPKGGNLTGKISEAINSQFGNLDGFKEDFSKAGMTRFGSGWAWLVVNEVGKLQITSTSNQDSPLLNSLKPILGLDVWEHAYYLNYQNKRADYIAAWWNVVNWDEVNKNLESALS